MLCFRYEDAAGVGPYTQTPAIRRMHLDEFGDESQETLNYAHNGMTGRPSPFDRDEPAEETFAVRGNYIFACKDEKTFRTWFWGWHEVIKARGQRLVIHDVPDELVQVGKSGQVMYRREYVAAVVDYAEVRFERICRKSPQRWAA